MLNIIKHIFIKGYLPKSFLSSVMILIEVVDLKLSNVQINKLDNEFIKILSEKKSTDLNELQILFNKPCLNKNEVYDRICKITEITMQICGFPKTEVFIKSHRESNHSEIIHLFAQELNDTHSNILKIVEALLKIINSLDKSTKEFYQNISKYKSLISILQNRSPHGVNTVKFIEAARDLDIPCRKIVGNIFQFGWGSKSRWLDSSFTDQTPNISTKLARSKLASTFFLRELGFPVPRNWEIKSSRQAIKIAEKIGYPVVIKAADLDGGVGVYSDLKTSSEIEAAFEKTSKLSKSIMIEEYVIGRDYRLQVFLDEVYWVAERQGPRVFGDGENNIKDLVQIFNETRLENNINSETKMPLIQLNKDIEDYLLSNGLNLDSVPEINQLVKLRAANNISGGGTLIPAVDIAHPDNLNLAINIVKTLRLDLAGVDLIIPDISISWKKTKAAVCEVNAQPQISGDRHKYVLNKLIKSKGRIPVILFLGNFKSSTLCKNIQHAADALKVNIGIASANQSWLNNQKYLLEASNLYDAGLSLITNPLIDIIFLEIAFDYKRELIFPVDKVDAIVLLEDILPMFNFEKNKQWFNVLVALTDKLICANGNSSLLALEKEISSTKIIYLTTQELENFLLETLT